MTIGVVIKLRYKTKSLPKVIIFWLAAVLLCIGGCTDPVEPEFKYREGLVYIEALASNATGASYVSIFVSVLEFGVNKNAFVEGANVKFVNTITGAQVTLTEEEELYVPPSDFTAQIGETWELSVVLPNGKEYRSEAETLTNPVEISEIEINYSPELQFNEEFNSFVPGHSISITLDDPANQQNFYYWRFRSFEKLIYCRTCIRSYFREGECQLFHYTITEAPPYFTYGCAEDCWQVRYGSKINLFSDEFSNGKTVNSLPVADIVLYKKNKILVELQQFSLSLKAYEYYKIIKDLVDNNGGFNAPLPAALIGNMYNPNDENEFVLGRFTAAPSSTKQVLIDRSMVEEFPLEETIAAFPESFGGYAPAPQVLAVPCDESRFRTKLRPLGWQD